MTTGQFIDFAPVPGEADRILATTGKGELVEVTLDGRTTAVPGAPRPGRSRDVRTQCGRPRSRH
ncbi:MAG: hypothetical protein ACRDO1_18110 [Nocardioidaceae bacterium]